MVMEGCLGQPSPKTEGDGLLTQRSCLQAETTRLAQALASASGCHGLDMQVAPTQEAAPLLQTALVGMRPNRVRPTGKTAVRNEA